MKQVVLFILGIARTVIDVIVGLYFMYLIYIAFAGGTAWLTNLEFSGGIGMGLLWLFIIAPLSLAIFDFLLNLVLFSVIAPVIFLFDRSAKIQQAAAGELVTDNNGVVYYGFGGWLYLVALGAIVSFGQSVFYLIEQLLPLYTSGNMQVISQQSPTLAFAILFETIFNSYNIVIILLAAYFCIKLRKAFVKTMIVFYLSRLVIGLIYILILNIVPELDKTMIDTQWNQISSAFVTCLIWIPYFIRSRRVKNTFVL